MLELLWRWFWGHFCAVGICVRVLVDRSIEHNFSRLCLSLLGKFPFVRIAPRCFSRDSQAAFMKWRTVISLGLDAVNYIVSCFRKFVRMSAKRNEILKGALWGNHGNRARLLRSWSAWDPALYFTMAFFAAFEKWESLEFLPTCFFFFFFFTRTGTENKRFVYKTELFLGRARL